MCRYFLIAAIHDHRRALLFAVGDITGNFFFRRSGNDRPHFGVIIHPVAYLQVANPISQHRNQSVADVADHDCY